MSNMKVHFSSATDHYSTPKDVYDALHAEFNFDFDPCPLSSKQDLLHSSWGACNFVNPPYSNIKEWVRTAYHTWLKGATIVLLIPSRTDTRWWHEYVMKATEIRFIKGRLKFGDSKNSAPFPYAIIIFKGAAYDKDRR